jgi:hypothetical protein
MPPDRVGVHACRSRAHARGWQVFLRRRKRRPGATKQSELLVNVLHVLAGVAERATAPFAAGTTLRESGVPLLPVFQSG